MRVLWFTNTPSLAGDFLQVNSKGGGWISSLEQQVAKVNTIQLGVAFHHNLEEINHFEIKGTTYYCLPKYEIKGKFNKWRKRWMHQLEPESVISDYVKVIEEFKPDLIHVFGTEQAFGLITEHVKIPVIIQIQGNLNVILKKWFSGINKYQLIRYSDLSLLIHAYSLWHEYLLFKKKAVREQIIFRNCRFFIGRTEWDKKIIKTFSENGMYFHCDELMREQFYQNKWTPKESDNIIFISTLNSSIYKGLEVVLQVASELKLRLGQKFEWRIVGITQEDEIVRITEKSALKKFDENNVIFLGPLDSGSLINNLLNSNCYIHPSHIENSANSICEAMLLGMPIIATFAGGTPSILIDKQEGVLVQDGDPYVFCLLYTSDAADELDGVVLGGGGVV
jgi:glycosyltransferase involved in cell wall biosynthesis